MYRLFAYRPISAAGNHIDRVRGESVCSTNTANRAKSPGDSKCTNILFHGVKSCCVNSGMSFHSARHGSISSRVKNSGCRSFSSLVTGAAPSRSPTWPRPSSRAPIAVAATSSLPRPDTSHPRSGATCRYTSWRSPPQIGRAHV